MRRLVEPEILDSMAADDPAALASRLDLRRINFLMGNERWILRQVRTMRGTAGPGVVEWGAGTGELLGKLSASGPALGVDLLDRPAGLPASADWIQADVLMPADALAKRRRTGGKGGGSGSPGASDATTGDDRAEGTGASEPLSVGVGGILVANLFLHHFEGAGLRALGEMMEGFSAVVAVEPWRSPWALALGKAMSPFVSRVTRHDMAVSIRAGFARDELADALGLDRRRWAISERIDPRGGLRWRALRK